MIKNNILTKYMTFTLAQVTGLRHGRLIKIIPDQEHIRSCVTSHAYI